MEELDAERVAREWLMEMQSCVRAADYARARAIFSPDVVGFGSRGAMLIGLDALERDQWRHVWSSIRNFTFLLDEMHYGASDPTMLWLACPWTSEAVDPPGTDSERPGRITAILSRAGERWLAVHTHHSLARPAPVV